MFVKMHTEGLFPRDSYSVDLGHVLESACQQPQVTLMENTFSVG